MNNAGRELDAMVAERVMGATWDGTWLRPTDYPGGYVEKLEGCRPFYSNNMPGFSMNIGAAWLVVERMTKLLEDADEAGVTFPWEGCNYLALQQLGAHAGWAATFCCILDDDEWFEHPEKFGGVKAESAPLAICLAALKALETANV